MGPMENPMKDEYEAVLKAVEIGKGYGHLVGEAPIPVMGESDRLSEITNIYLRHRTGLEYIAHCCLPLLVSRKPWENPTLAVDFIKGFASRFYNMEDAENILEEFSRAGTGVEPAYLPFLLALETKGYKAYAEVLTKFYTEHSSRHSPGSPPS